MHTYAYAWTVRLSFVFLLLLFCHVPAHASCTAPTGGGVTVCSPTTATSSTQANPVHFIAAASAPASCTKGVAAVGIYSAPGVRVYVVNGSTLDTFLPLAPATYAATVQEWDNCGGSLKQNLTIKVLANAAYTHQYNNQRTGANLFETTLTPANVNGSNFGRKFTFQTDRTYGLIYGQPLYVPNVTVAGVKHNVVYLVTEDNTIYAVDADTGAQLWRDYIDKPAPMPCPDPPNQPIIGCGVAPLMGITSTPVIDPSQGSNGAIYVVSRTAPTGANPFYLGLHKFDLSTGNEMSGSPQVISATAKGTGYTFTNWDIGGSYNDAPGGTITFDVNTQSKGSRDTNTQNNRSALLYANGVIYIAFSALGNDVDPYHGWIIGYDATTMKQVCVFITTPNGGQGGIWGGPLAADLSNVIFADTGNGAWDGSTDWGSSYLKLSPSGSTLAVLDWFTPFNESTLSADDLDLGSAGAILLPSQSGPFPNEMVGAGKEGRIYVVNRDNMGHFHSGSDSQIIQSIPNAVGSTSDEERNFSTPAYWNENVYFFGVDDPGKAFTFNNGVLSTSPTSTTATFPTARGSTPTVSANGNTNGIVWQVSYPTGGSGGSFYAYDATNLAKTLYSDFIGTNVMKFAAPLVMNGKVYVGTQTELIVYGLLP